MLSTGVFGDSSTFYEFGAADTPQKLRGVLIRLVCVWFCVFASLVFGWGQVANYNIGQQLCDTWGQV